MKRAVVHVSMELLHSLLRLPENITVLHVVPDHHGLSLGLVITADDMAEVAPGFIPPDASITYYREGDHVETVIHYPKSV